MFELSGVNYEEVLEQGDSILVRVIGGSSYRDYNVYIYIYIPPLDPPPDVCYKEANKTRHEIECNNIKSI